MSLNNSNLIAIATKNAMEKHISHYDKSQVLYPIGRYNRDKVCELINKKAINICEGRLNYIKLRMNSYEVKDAKEIMICWANGDDCGITSMKKKIEKQKSIIGSYDIYLDKLFIWNEIIDNKDTDKKIANKSKKQFKEYVIKFLFIIEKWNTKQSNKCMEFMRPDITHGNGRLKIRRKIIEEFERNLDIEKRELEHLYMAYANLSHIKKQMEKIENGFLNAKYNPRTKIGYKFMNELYDENF